MNILEFEKDSCQGCYKCIRHCEVKAITYKDNFASINIRDCILCGECVNVCPNHAKHVRSDMDYILSLIENHEEVYVSLAPSYKAYFKNTHFSHISMALKKMGFKQVEETVIGANAVNNEYLKYINERKTKHLITSACYSTILLIEKHYPQLVKYLIPVDSPMMAHAKKIKAANPKARVVFIGPCVSKKAEAVNIINSGVIDGVLTFENIEDYFIEHNINLDEKDQDAFGADNPKTRLYPKDAGVIDSVDFPEDNKYELIHVNGLTQVKQLFDQLVLDIENDNLPSYFIETHICNNSCIGGPVFRKKHILPSFTKNYYHTNHLKRDEHLPSSVNATANLHHPYFARSNDDLIPTEEDIQFILNMTGKFKPEDELNCGACGYATCREKAVAVFQKKADIDMCLPFFKKRAESLSNMIIDHSPNAIFVLNEMYEVQEFNQSAGECFKLSKSETLNNVLPFLLQDNLLEEASIQGGTIRRRVVYEEFNKICQVSVTHVTEHHLFLVIIIDMTEIETQKQHMHNLRQETIEATDAVIEKQMRVVQEIASLLGETTAETKVTLTKLKKIVTEEGKTL